MRNSPYCWFISRHNRYGLSKPSVCWHPTWRSPAGKRFNTRLSEMQHLHVSCSLCSDARENWQSGVSGRGAEDTRLDQEANAWGRNGGDPNRYRPKGLPKKY